ncbi:MAG TPA: hypothetical protein VN696_06350 [Pyrinomonadaceae bacterium]|nr:hypothetical protein [Pyrinomonadaceae bacterium]
MSRQKRTTIAISLFLVFATSQVYLVNSFARVNAPSVTTGQQPTGVLSTQGNQAITVNGVSTSPGATILPGATVETPAGVGATIDFGQLGSVQIDPNSRVTVDFQNGSIKVTVLQGCVTLHTKRGTRGEVDTQGSSRTTDAAKDGVVHLCAPGAVPPGTSNGGGGGLGAKVLVPVFAATGATFALLAWRGNNPSPGGP